MPAKVIEQNPFSLSGEPIVCIVSPLIQSQINVF